MRAAERSDRVLILGGAGMVGLQVAREIAKLLAPSEIVVSSLTRREVDEAIAELSAEAKSSGWKTRFVAAAGDIFLPTALQEKNRNDIVRDRELFDILFDDIFSPDPEAYRKSALFTLIDEYKPDVVVDCINTATAISYQDAFTTSRRVKLMLDQIESKPDLDRSELSTFLGSVRELLIAQGVPQITRHILFLDRALRSSSVRVYVKVGTTGTGGMGINIPYTHSEDKPSATLLSKSAIGFAHTGLLFLLARTPAGAGAEDRATMIKEIKPGAMIGFKRLGPTHVKLTGASGRREPGLLLAPKVEKVGSSIQPRGDFNSYSRFDGRDVPVKMVGADTGENGFFSIGEFQAITWPRQMEYVTPEEVARTVVLEILGSSTGRDVISAIDGAITEPSYRAGVLRDHACREMERLEDLFSSGEDFIPSIAVGHLGPPQLSKLLIEAYLLRAAAGSSDLATLIAIDPETMRKNVEDYVAKHPRIESLVVTIGIPLLRDHGGALSLTRGPRLNIPVAPPDGTPVAIDKSDVEKYAAHGWVDLRQKNFTTWHERLNRLAACRPDIAKHGSAAFDHAHYIPDRFIPGDVVGWLLTNEVDERGMVGRRML